MPLDIAPKTVNKVMITDIIIKVGNYIQVILNAGYDSDNGFVAVESVGTIFLNGIDLDELVMTQTNGADIYSNIRDILYAFLIDKGYITADGSTVTINYFTTQERVDAEAGV